MNQLPSTLTLSLLKPQHVNAFCALAEIQLMVIGGGIKRRRKGKRGGEGKGGRRGGGGGHSVKSTTVKSYKDLTFRNAIHLLGDSVSHWLGADQLC